MPSKKRVRNIIEETKTTAKCCLNYVQLLQTVLIFKALIFLAVDAPDKKGLLLIFEHFIEQKKKKKDHAEER